MTTTPKIVNWKTYAQKYDLLLAHNPFYQKLHQEVMEAIRKWDIHEGDHIADIGAGTGNYSLPMAQLFPQATVLHIDRDEGMNAQAAKKKADQPLYNHRILNWSVDDIQLQPASLRALISIHALYTFPDPQKTLRQMYDWLEPGGDAILVNAGRIVNVLDWQLAIGWHLIRQYGIRKTLHIMKEGREVSRQNAYIREMQRKGTFWTHTHEEFCEAVEKAGFRIEQHCTSFRGISDFVVAKKA